MKIFLIALFCISAMGIGEASDWTHWRGPMQNGASPETGLISTWSLDGENLIWRREFIGRSTPVIVNGRVYVIGRAGKGITQQEHIACFDAETGDLLWGKKSSMSGQLDHFLQPPRVGKFGRRFRNRQYLRPISSAGC